MPLATGARIGPYEILEPIGKGGMGEVYRARDTTLDRDVAIKVLPEAFASDEERVARFEREAKLLASLNHPNIAGIYGFESSALVLELVEGSTLAERIEQGPIPVEDALAIAKQIAEALEAGHERGIVHRDLKPANVKLKDDGTVKVLDYGLAKALEGDAPSGTESELSQSPTLTRQGTQIGVILGTAAYMSPEQARGRPLDKRADIWAFGVVLYEMVTGKRLFEGEDLTETLASIVKVDPDISAAPPRVRRLLTACLRKDPKKRLRDIGDTWELLEEAVPGQATRPERYGLAVAGVAAAVALAAGLAIGAGLLAPTPPAPRVTRLPIDMHPLTGRVQIDLSRDGRHLVFAANGQLFLRSMDEAEPRPISGTEGARHPFFSPDGERVAFYANGQLLIVPVSGGVPFVVADFREIQPGWWGDRGQIFFGVSRNGPIYRVSETGGTPEVFAEPEEYADLDWPTVLPGGDWVLFSGQKAGGEQEIVAQSVSTGERRTILSGGKFARYAPSGHLVYFRDSRLWGVGFDTERMEVTGEPVLLGERVQSVNETIPFSPVSFRIADDGSLVYVEDLQSAGLSTLALVDRDTGAVEELGVPPAAYLDPRIAPDGRRFLVNVYEKGDETLWVHDLSGVAAPRRLTLEGSVRGGVWTPDGERITFGSGQDLFETSANGTGVPELLVSAAGGRPYSWSRDARYLAYLIRAGGGSGIWTFRSDDRVTEPFYESADNPRLAQFSPDGKWIAYVADQAGAPQVWVQPFPPTGARVEITREPAIVPLWSPDGRTLFYLQPDVGGDTAEVHSVSVDTESGFAFGRPQSLGITLRIGNNYDITPDGRKFLVVRDASASGNATPPRVYIVLNWTQELEERVPSP